MKRRRSSRKHRPQSQPPRWILVPTLAAPFDPKRSQEALAAMQDGDWAKAQALLEPIAAADPSARNNLALTYLSQGDAARALDALQPNLASKAGPQPFARALAVRCLAALGRKSGDARRELDLAVADFEAGLLAGPKATPSQWREYSVALLLAAGALEDDTLTWSLYQRGLAVHIHPEAHYLGGIAAFNRQRWSDAERAWSRIAKGTFLSTEPYLKLLPLLASGAVPPYRLTYEVPDFHGFASTDADSPLARFLAAASSEPSGLSNDDQRFALETAADPHRWSVMLAWAFDEAALPEHEERQELTAALVRFGGERGDALARAIFRSSSLPLETKVAAANALLLSGRLAAGSEGEMRINGTTRRVRIARPEVIWSDGAMDQRYQEALAARDRGDLTLARQIVSSMADPAATMHAPSMLLYASFLRAAGEFNVARQLLEPLLDIAPERSIVRLHLAALEVQVRRPAQAREHLDRARELGVRPAEKRTFERLWHDLTAVERLVRHHQKLGQDPSSERSAGLPVQVDADLAQLLMLLPGRWLRAAAVLHGLKDPHGSRQQGEAPLLIALRRDPAAALQRALDTDPGGQLPALLHHLVTRVGWCRREEVVNMFGLDADLVWTAHDRAFSTLGHARLACVVFQGTADVDGRPQMLVGIPMELREACADIVVPAPARPRAQ